VFYISVVKEEIGDDFANLPCFNGRVVSWVCAIAVFLDTVCQINGYLDQSL